MAKGDDQYTTALEIWDVLTKRAIDRETLTFNGLADIIFGKKKGGAVNASLEVVGVFCKERELPHLTVLVVRQGQQKPGKSFLGDWDRVDDERERVFACDWHWSIRPTPDQLKQVFDKKKGRGG